MMKSQIKLKNGFLFLIKTMNEKQVLKELDKKTIFV